jgi:hypothetical protein
MKEEIAKKNSSTGATPCRVLEICLLRPLQTVQKQTTIN